MTRVFRIADITASCSTRERARMVYSDLVAFARAGAGAKAELVISFEDVELVTPSFLDEIVSRLVGDKVTAAVTLQGIREFPIRAFERILHATGSKIVVRHQGHGAFCVAAA